MSDVADAYRRALESYVVSGRSGGGGEADLETAYALGRQAVADGMTILGLVDLHRMAVDAVARGSATPLGPELVEATFTFLSEALATFEMAQRGYWEAQERARVEREHSELREQLARAYLTVETVLELPDRLAAIEVAAAELVGAAGARCHLVDSPAGARDRVDADGGDMIFRIREPAGETVAVLGLDLGDRGPLSRNERFLLREFSHMVGVAVENARQFAREQQVALMLQRDLLPIAVPRVAGLDVAMRYLPGEATSHAGGDWYDLFPLPQGRVGLVVGDVTGHGVGAAAAMGQLRMAVLAYALAGFEPSDVVRRIDALLEALGGARIATLVYVIADPATGELVIANAGHPPPVVVAPDGRARTVTDGHGLLLGLSPAAERHDGTTRVPPGGHLLLYTDGLIEPHERLGRDGIVDLVDAVEGFTGTADELCDWALAELVTGHAGDDICILAATFNSRA